MLKIELYPIVNLHHYSNQSHMKTHQLFIALSFIAIVACSKKMTDSTVKQSSTNTMNAKETFVNQLLAKMTLEEKIGQMNQYNGFWDVTGPPPANGGGAEKYANLKAGLVGSMLNITGVDRVRKLQEIAVKETRLGIPLIFGHDVIHGFKTLAPIPLAEAASWDLKAIEKSASVAATEASAVGINWTFAPMVDISRDARWGRVMEGAGEDPYLGSLIGAARVKGFQGSSLSATNTIASCLKHYAGYGFAEAGRDYNSVDMSNSTLHNVILPPFKLGVEAGAASVMNAFNDLNGVPATAHAYILKDILKKKWGFKGFVVSDWGSIGELVIHGAAKDGVEAAMLAANAGTDMDMESYFYLNHLPQLVNSGKVAESDIDDAVRRILQVKYDLGLFEDPFKYCDEARQKEMLYNPAHKAAVRDVAKRSIVLLKNEGNLLPLKSGSKVAVIGPHVKDKNSPLGSWRIGSDDNTAVSLWEGLEPYKSVNWSYAMGVKLTNSPATFQEEVDLNMKDTTGFAQAIAVAKASDVVILNIGEHGFMSGEGRSRTQINIPGLQEDLMKAIYAVNKNIILVLQTGRPLDLSWADQNIPAIVLAWHLGSESGNAIADVLMGQYNPAGKLPMTFPRNVGQVPIYYNIKNTGRPNGYADNPKMVFWSHYSDSEKTPLYPFGYGLSYTKFDYSGFTVSKNLQGGINATITLKNVGQLAGEEVVQLYIRDKVAKVTRPIKELKDFVKVNLKPGESKMITFDLTRSDLSYLDDNGNPVFESGAFDIMVGTNSSNVMTATIDL